jgi:hypothetical protein
MAGIKFSARTKKSATNAQNTGQIAFFIFSPTFVSGSENWKDKIDYVLLVIN